MSIEYCFTNLKYVDNWVFSFFILNICYTLMKYNRHEIMQVTESKLPDEARFRKNKPTVRITGRVLV